MPSRFARPTKGLLAPQKTWASSTAIPRGKASGVLMNAALAPVPSTVARPMVLSVPIVQ